jgi:peptidyl-prolyl cis-trans isomerase SurA
MRKIISCSLFLLILIPSLIAQDYKNNILITIDDREITAGEFERVYNKNNNDNVAQKQTVEEYLDMFINYKLKVIEAEELGMDTASNFLSEFNAYKKQLAQPYMTSDELTEKFAREAYERMKEEINASHIMVRLSSGASPEDTAYAYNKLMEIRNRVTNGEDFEKVARATSDDPSAKNNAGRLGWFSAFRMVYPFESAAYKTPVGEISLPVRSNFGYHILKIHDRRTAKGSRQVAHIFMRAPESMTAEEAKQAQEKIYMVYDSLKQGREFSDMANTYSDDQASGRQGGVLPWFSSGQMIPVFDSVAFALETIGDFSEPVKSNYGWHILKLLDKKNIGSFEEEKPEILSNIKKGDRGKSRDRAFINQLKEEYGYEFYQENFDKMLSTLDSTVFYTKWNSNKATQFFELPVFTIGDHDVRIEEFAKYFEEKNPKRQPMDFRMLLGSYYEPFEDQEILAFEESNLEEKYPEFRHIVQEYHDGILLFDLTDKMVWTKAVEDSTGLENFYEKNKSNYMWGERAETIEILLQDSTLELSDIKKRALKLVKRTRFDADKFKERFCGSDTAVNCLEITQNNYEKGDNEKVDELKWKSRSFTTFTKNGDQVFLFINQILEPSIKKLDETRGLVIADYQKFLEDKWLEELRSKYEIKVDRELLAKIKD